MKRYSFWVKCLTFFLAVVTLLGVAIGALGILLAESMNMYGQDDYKTWRYSRSENMAETLAGQVMQDYAGQFSKSPQWLLEQTGYEYSIENGMSWYELSENDWYYAIIDPNGKVVASTQKELEDPLVFLFGAMSAAYPVIVTPPAAVPESDDAAMVPDQTDVPEGTTMPATEPTLRVYNDEEYYDVYYAPYTEEEVWVQYDLLENYQVNIGIRADHSGYYVSNGFSMAFMEWMFSARYLLIILTAGSFLLFAVVFVFLMNVAGKSPVTGAAEPKALNRLPLDIYLAAAVFITILGCIGAFELLQMLFGNDGYHVLLIILLCSCGIAVAVTDIGFFMAVAAQFKLTGNHWWHNSICGRVFRWVFGWLKKGIHFVIRGIQKVLGMLPVIWEWIAVGGSLGILLLLICVGFAAHWYTVFPLFLWCLAFAAVVIYCGYCFGTIRKGIRRMNEGDLDEKINTRWMYGSFKTIAEELNALADVVIIAAEKQLRSERMKTELITNVSHDIKTPLTSVINYVDLLQQPHTEEEEAQYLEVLSRQSLRLKKLVEDLMDMSKASSGNIAVNIAAVDAVETVNQALGEFADKLDGAKLTPVFRTPDRQLHMLADGKLTWRVLSNILSNVVKYALPGTRVYIDLLRLDKQVVLSVKNISREELNISADELTERFVRGDASRNTEGSGLGLNIAQSLMRLQRGNMDVTVDGDLFKVTLTFSTE